MRHISGGINTSVDVAFNFNSEKCFIIQQVLPSPESETSGVMPGSQRIIVSCAIIAPTAMQNRECVFDSCPGKSPKRHHDDRQKPPRRFHASLVARSRVAEAHVRPGQRQDDQDRRRDENKRLPSPNLKIPRASRPAQSPVLLN